MMNTLEIKHTFANRELKTWLTTIAKPKILANYLLFQLGWFACVSTGGTAWHWAGTLAVTGIVLFHIKSAISPRQELLLVCCAVAIGLCWESLLVALGLLEYKHGTIATFLAPHWIIAIWALFATTVNLSMSWLKSKLLMSSLLGAIGGPLSFYAGHKLGAVQIPNFTLAMIALACGWAILMPSLMILAERYNGFQSSAVAKANH
jgi:hypothetical protein